MNPKTIISSKIKGMLKENLRTVNDIFSGHSFQFAKKNKVLLDLKYSIDTTQIIKNNSGVEAKLHNIKRASQFIEAIQIDPSEIFSFWKIIGNPSEKRGFQKGRTILNGELSDSVGGGLCQLSGLIYLISLEANLEILERHNHSLDLYNEATRYTPLGSDATIVYGYKDLRIRNNYDFPIRFSFQISDDQISIFLFSLKEIKKAAVKFVKQKASDRESKVITFINGIKCNTSTYAKTNQHL